ncbi:hypothetical protein CEXT_148801 [Caerostris extrusa]|uniref:Uncharacterized protein n=1 Tax=Caerostris extrusa TaxID=172846 RepID=A0AAV4RV71_CAEEX|nr:hypothetical protein CEXT_148801 [Caerostris extrusa]
MQSNGKFLQKTHRRPKNPHHVFSAKLTLLFPKLKPKITFASQRGFSLSLTFFFFFCFCFYWFFFLLPSLPGHALFTLVQQLVSDTTAKVINTRNLLWSAMEEFPFACVVLQ